MYDEGLVFCEGDQVKQADLSVMFSITTTGGPPVTLT